MRIGILVPTLTDGDAVSQDAFGMAEAARERGHEVELFALRNTSEQAARGVHELGIRLNSSEDAIIYHHQIGFESGVRAFDLLPASTKIVKYHNVTPPEFFAETNPELARACRDGLRQAEHLARSSAILWADSEYNAEQLREFAPGKHVEVLPPFHPVEALLQAEPDTRAASGFDDWRTNLLVVGRIVPNKNLLLAVDVLTEYREKFDPHTRLIFAGDTPVSAYREQLIQHVHQRGQGGHVFLTGKISASQLKMLYLLADALLQTSLHEGFCVPLVEAMALRVPVVAMPNAAIPHTAERAARYGNSVTELGQQLHELISRPDVLEGQLRLGRERYSQLFSTDRIQAKFLQLLDTAISTTDRRQPSPFFESVV